jgi:hypothetical protein
MRDVLAGEIDAPAHPLGDDLLLFDSDHLEAVRAAVHVACEVDSPPREQLRAAWLEGDGEWSAHGLLGPLADGVERAVQSIPWGTAERLGELPAPLPPPPRAHGMWAAVGALAAVGMVLLRLAWAATAGAAPAPPLVVDWAVAPDAVWASFDAPDADPVGVVALVDGRLTVLSDGSDAASKAPLAVGDGSFRARADDGLLLVHSDRPVDLPALVATAGSASSPLEGLVVELRRRHPGATVAWRAR